MSHLLYSPFSLKERCVLILIEYVISYSIPKAKRKGYHQRFKNNLLCFLIIMVRGSIFLLKHRGRQSYLQKVSQGLPLLLFKTTFIKPLPPVAGAGPSLENLYSSDIAFHFNFKHF
jgi:hypothetical protein